MTDITQRPRPLGAAAFRALYRRLAEAASRGADDRRGALNYITPAQVLAAAGEVRSGRTVSLARPIESVPSADNPEPLQHEMTGYAADRIRVPGLEFGADRFRMNVHGDADSHIDALCHVIYDDHLYNGVSVETLTPTGASAPTIDTAHDGIAGRGVLLDIPRVRGISWLEPGDHVTVDDLVAAEPAGPPRRAGRSSVRASRATAAARRARPLERRKRSRRHGPNRDGVRRRAQVAVLGSDGNSDTAPSTTEGVAFPVHVLAINAMGLQLLDYLSFEDLVPLCEGRDGGRSCA